MREQDLVDVHEAARLTGRSRWALYKCASDGTRWRAGSVRRRGRLLFSRAALLAWVKAQRLALDGNLSDREIAERTGVTHACARALRIRGKAMQ